MKKLNPIHYPYYAAAIQSIQYAHAGFVYLSWVGMVTAGLLGVLVSFASAIASSKINDIAKGRKKSAWVMLVLLLLVSPAFVGVGMWIALDVITVPVWRIVVAALWGLIPDGSVALVGFITGKGMIAKDERPQSEPQATPSGRKRPAKKIPCEWCGKPINDSQNARNAHSPHCKVLQEAAKVER